MSSLRSNEPIKSPDIDSTDPRKVKYHPYKALRLRGFMHIIPSSNLKDEPYTYEMNPDIAVPGFSRIFFVLYKPTTRYLVQTLEYWMGDYGSPWTLHVGQQLQNQQAAANVPGNSAPGGNTVNGNPAAGIGTGTANATANPAPANIPVQAAVNNAAISHDPAQAEKILQAYLDDLLDGEREVDLRDSSGNRVFVKNEQGISDFATKKVKNFPMEKWTRENINTMEEAYSDVFSLNWEDIEYAYGYEGVMTPGGKVMMGRWWRMGLNGEGVSDGYEVDCEGLGVKVVNGEALVRVDDGGEGEDGGAEGRWRKSKGLERGPFVFWT